MGDPTGGEVDVVEPRLNPAFTNHSHIAEVVDQGLAVAELEIAGLPVGINLAGVAGMEPAKKPPASPKNKAVVAFVVSDPIQTRTVVDEIAVRRRCIAVHVRGDRADLLPSHIRP